MRLRQVLIRAAIMARTKWEGRSDGADSWVGCRACALAISVRRWCCAKL